MQSTGRPSVNPNYQAFFSKKILDAQQTIHHRKLKAIHETGRAVKWLLDDMCYRIFSADGYPDQEKSRKNLVISGGSIFRLFFITKYYENDYLDTKQDIRGIIGDVIPPFDLDFYAADAAHFAPLRNKYHESMQALNVKNDYTHRINGESENAWNIPISNFKLIDRIQLIKPKYPTVQEAIETFDAEHCKGIYYPSIEIGEESKLYIPQKMLECILYKKIMWCDPVPARKRVKKWDNFMFTKVVRAVNW